MRPIGHQICQKRLERGMTQAELAQKANIPQPNLSNIEQGRRDITISTLRRIAYGLRVELIDFFRSESRQNQPLFPLTRSRLERMAHAIATGKQTHLPFQERELVDLFREMIPEVRKRPLGVKRINQNWLKLKSKLDSSTMNQIMNRVRDAWARQR